MALTASLPMYDLQELRGSTDAFWGAIKHELMEAGLRGLPDHLQSDCPALPASISDTVLLTQTCGFPLQTLYSGQYRRLGVPKYDLPGDCTPNIPGPTHRGLFVVREGDPAEELRGLRGRAFACNSLYSNSGMNLPRRTLAPLAERGSFFAQVIFTGSHVASLKAVQTKVADSASIDSVTYALLAEHRPSAITGLRVLAETVASPAIPFVTSIATGEDVFAILKDTLTRVATLPRYSTTCQSLHIQSISAPEKSDYGLLLNYQLQAAVSGYPVLS